MRLRVVVTLLALCISVSLAAQQETGANAQATTVPFISNPVGEYEVKIVLGEELLVRKKGTPKWTPSSKLNEPIAVGLLDGTEKIYVYTKAIQPPKVKPDPDYPEGEKQLGAQGEVFLHIVVDPLGKVHMPKVDQSPTLEFATTALETVKKWTFEPGKLNGQPVAVLINVSMEFRLYPTRLRPTH